MCGALNLGVVDKDLCLFAFQLLRPKAEFKHHIDSDISHIIYTEKVLRHKVLILQELQKILAYKEA